MRRFICALLVVFTASLISVAQPAQQTQIPWMNPEWRAGAKLEDAEAVVIAIDNSGSIKDIGRLPQERGWAKDIIDFLDWFNPFNPVLAVVAFNSDIRIVVPPTPLNALNLNQVKAAIDGIGDTSDLTWLNGVIDHACTITQPFHPWGTLVLFTDGKPTTPDRNGVLDIPTAMTQTLLRAINFQANCSTLAVIGIDVSGEDEEFLRQIASPGAFLYVTSNPRIAFQSHRDGNKEVYVMNADGSDQKRLTYNQAWDSEPAWSPGGRQIAFVSDRDGNREIYVMNADGTGLKRLTYSQAWDCSPAWSPDGSQIAFVSDRDGNDEIYVMNTDGSGQTRLTYNRERDYYPAWSPDGSQIVFESYRDDIESYSIHEIYVMNADGSNLKRLTYNTVSDGDPSWSPDGTRIAFWSTRDGYYSEIYVMNADGSNLKRLTYNTVSDRDPTWSPDGTRIAFCSDRDGNPEIYAMNADGSGQTNMTNNPDWDYSPAWSPW